MTMTHTAEQRSAIIDTLRLSDRDLNDLLTRPSHSKAGASDERSSHGEGAQQKLLDLPRMLVHICHQTGNCRTFLVKPRDLHSNGIVFLHGSYVNEGAKCYVLLRQMNGKPAQLTATVLHCRLISGRIHEVVATFDRAIVMEDYRFHDGSPLPDSKEPANAI